MEDKILILGASELQAPLIKKANEMGYYTGVLDYNPNAYGRKYASEFFLVSTTDVNGIMEVAKKFKPKGIVTMATDMPMRAIATVCKELKLQAIAPETAFKATDKVEMIKAFSKYQVPCPKFAVLHSEDEIENKMEGIEFPCIMKPADSSGSRGVVKVLGIKELKRAFHYSRQYSKTGVVLLEEYLVGKEISVEAFVCKEQVFVLAITEKITTGAPHFVEMGHTQPANIAVSEQEEVFRITKKAIEAIGIQTGPAHIEMMLTDRGPVMIELGARLGGDCIASHLLPLSTGIDIVKATIDSACGKVPELIKKHEKASAIRYIKAEEGLIKQILGVDEAKNIPGIRDIIIVKREGERSKEIESSTDRIGMVIAQGEDRESAVCSCERAIEKIKIVVE